MSAKNIEIEKDLKQVDVTSDIGAIVGNRTTAVLAWYKIAQENLVSAEILLQNRKIPHTIFFIQQCVECLVKGTFLEAGILNESTTIQICHSPEKAYQTLYKHIDYSWGLYYCEEIPRQLNKGSSFEDKLKISASIANQFTTHYWEDYNNAAIDVAKIVYENPTALGLPSNATQLQCHYRYLESMYAENMLLLFSCVFSHKVENDVRYPKVDSNPVILPSDTYNSKIIEEGLQTIIPVLKSILKSIVGESFLG